MTECQNDKNSPPVNRAKSFNNATYNQFKRVSQASKASSTIYSQTNQFLPAERSS